MNTTPDPERLRLERDLFLRLLELGAREDLPPFLDDALALVVEVVGAHKGYLELLADGPNEAPFRIAHGFEEAELAEVRRAISSGIIAEALATGRTISTASATEDPRFRAQASVKAQRIKAVLCAPVGTSPSIGVLYLQGRQAPGPFPESARSLVELFARHLAPLADRLILREHRALGEDHTREPRTRLSVEGIAGTSRALAEVFRQVLVAAPVTIPVLITGESGTGKTQLARAIHQSSPRARGPFVELNCAALPEGLFESELFGAEKGAHSTATRRIEGKVEAARGGTLLLDEIAEIPPALQSKLLSFLQSRRFYRLGGTSPLEADVRIIAATNANLEELIAAKRFREDLYYRLNVLEVQAPPLRARREDIAPIAEAIVGALGKTHGRALPLSRAARAALTENEWPGNVRQLENVLSRGWAVALSQDASMIEVGHLFPNRRAEAENEGENENESGIDALSYEEAMRRFQARFVREALERYAWNVSETARRIGIARSHLNDLIRAHGLSRGGKGASK